MHINDFPAQVAQRRREHAQHTEEIIWPDLPIIDAHHHIWKIAGARYELPELLDDLRSGHNVTATVYVQSLQTGYRTGGPHQLRPVGETAALKTIGDEAALLGFPFVCKGIVGFADLMLGAKVEEVLTAHMEAGAGKFRGVRQSALWDATGYAHGSPQPHPQLLLNRTFREGYARLQPLGLSFEAWVFHTQFSEIADLAKAFPGTKIIMNHTGGPIGRGPYQGKRDEVFATWAAGLKRLSPFENVFMKLGGLGMGMADFDFDTRAAPITSAEIAAAWRPYFESCVSTLGSNRCMFESNFPPDNLSCNYPVLWNSFKLSMRDCSVSQRADLFFGTANHVYNLGV